MRRIQKLLSVVAIGFIVTGCMRPVEPVVNIENESLLVKDRFSLRNIEMEIIEAAVSRGWKVATLEPGRLEATLTIRKKFFVVVEITHTADALSIRYKDSRRFEYDGTHIHWKVNKWIRHLRTGIIRRTAVLNSRTARLRPYPRPQRNKARPNI